MLEEMVEDERPEVSNLDKEESVVVCLREEEVDDTDKIVETCPRTSGSRPTFSAAVALNLFVFCAKLTTIAVGEGIGTTHRDIDEGPSGNSRPT